MFCNRNQAPLLADNRDQHVPLLAEDQANQWGNNQPIAYQQPHFLNGQQPQIVYPNGVPIPNQNQFPQVYNNIPNPNYQEGHNNMANQSNPIVLVPMPLDQAVRNNQIFINQNDREYDQHPANFNNEQNSFERRLSIASNENRNEPFNHRITSGQDLNNFESQTSRN